ncbi:PAS domain-containing protein [Fertoebacter nigrum]|uniref:PAS domain-containing protein n=1 Tax=Fertoeibacter niger TaxID=2656921 RepID=A0A8X8H5D0_9RHOB|nr:PAS domain-containing protein [Fertoeibacter niger]NUB43306.1 PAS domain-containing protein [Fertoeibacter niger]
MTGATRFAAIAQVRAYWEGLRRGNDLPLRSAIDPRGIEGALEQAFLLERIAPGLARFRLAGMTLSDLMGMDVRGMPLSAMLDPSARLRLASVLEQVFREPAALDLSLEADRGIGRPALEGRMLIMPVRGDSGAELALGCLATEGLVGRSPRRFHIARALLEPLAPASPSGPVALPRQPVAGLADPPRLFLRRTDPPPPRTTGRAHLRLVRPDE